MVALAALAALAVAVVLGRLGRWPGPRRGPADGQPGGQPLSAADHRLRAAPGQRGRLRGGDPGSASGRSRGSWTSGPCSAPGLGRTADEMAAEAGLALPAEAAALRDAARMFDDICYGERPGTAAGYALVSDLDTRIKAAAPSPAPPWPEPAGCRRPGQRQTGTGTSARRPGRATGGRRPAPAPVRAADWTEERASRGASDRATRGQEAGPAAAAGAKHRWRAPLAVAGGGPAGRDPDRAAHARPGRRPATSIPAIPGRQGTRALAQILGRRGQPVGGA